MTSYKLLSLAGLRLSMNMSSLTPVQVLTHWETLYTPATWMWVPLSGCACESVPFTALCSSCFTECVDTRVSTGCLSLHHFLMLFTVRWRSTQGKMCSLPHCTKGKTNHAQDWTCIAMITAVATMLCDVCRMDQLRLPFEVALTHP